jgi:HEAT repeat protein
MTDAEIFGRLAPLVARLAIGVAACGVGAVVIERAAFGIQQVRQRRFEARYLPIVRRALAGDAEAEQTLVSCPRRHRLRVAALLIVPLIEEADPARLARTRRIVEAMSLLSEAERMLNSRLWWRRAVALRALGLLRIRDYTPAVVGALDDGHPEVRAAALDALADLRDPATIKAVVVRLLDTTLHRGRRVAALAAFGAAAEPLVLDLGHVDPAHRVGYARALAICGSRAAVPVLCAWTTDLRPEVRAAAFETLAHVGLDARAARLALDALAGGDAAVRAAAAHALHGWTGAGDAASHLARHLDDTWIVAIRAARSLQSIEPAGRQALQACAARTDLAGLLARQMLWEMHLPV